MTTIIPHELDPGRSYLLVHRTGEWVATELDPDRTYLMYTHERERRVREATVASLPEYAPRSWIQYVDRRGDDLGGGPAC